MIYIEYAEHGVAVSDFDYTEWLDRVKMAKLNSTDNDTKFVVSTSLPISAVMLAICRGEINNAHIAFIYKDKIFQADKNGRIAKWPKGFADIDGDLAFGILTCQAKRYKAERMFDKGGINNVV